MQPVLRARIHLGAQASGEAALPEHRSRQAGRGGGPGGDENAGSGVAWAWLLEVEGRTWWCRAAEEALASPCSSAQRLARRLHC